MARKPREQWTESYRKRIERAEARASREGRSFSKAMARGHRAKEHVTRKQNKLLRELGGSTLTPSQRGQITKFFQELPQIYQTEANKQKLIQNVEARGFEWFQQVRATRRELIKGSAQRPKGSGVLELAFDAIGITADDDMDWLMYYLGF